MAGVTYTPNVNFERDLNADAATKAAYQEFAETALEGARAAAPVLTGKYRESLYAEDGVLGSTSSFWHFMEWGSVHNSPHAPLRRGVEAAGLEMTDAR